MTLDPRFVCNVTSFLSSLGLVVVGGFSTAGVFELEFSKTITECDSAPLNPLSSSFTHSEAILYAADSDYGYAFVRALFCILASELL